MEFISQLNHTFNLGVTKPIGWRKGQLLALKRLMVENENAIYRALKADLNKSQTEAHASEFSYVLNDIKYFIKHLKSLSKPRAIGTPMLTQPGRSYLVPEPYGTVLIMGAWNYPIQLVLSPMIAAISAGNCVVLKPSELAMNVSNLIAELIPKYMDKSAVAVYEGGIEATTALLQQRFDYIMYTGSETVGKIVMRAASEHLTPVALELGGKSPCIVDDKTNMSVTADRIIWAKYLNAGQTCIAPDYILVTKKTRPLLIEALKKSVVKQYGEDPKRSNDFGRIVNDRHFARISGYLAAQNENVVFGGESDSKDNYISPTFVLNPDLMSDLMVEEIFGPVLPIVEVDSMQEAKDFVNQREKPLALYLFSQDNQTVEMIKQQTSSGTLCINDAVIFMVNHEMPFGGVGNSGMGCYHGKWGFDTFSHIKPVMHRSFFADMPIRYAPFTKLKSMMLKLATKL
ncbi:aldehyde dehydrogenase family protein [Psychrosphaera sp. 1_MG-2023]|uniref:aldehyde dehydrogenase family protein n=1 Tax=Psychrosphaera sp. 1_MG-2023 TaxID=3062643 RepID=UPI0026E1F106|nr:aldehyde dehydrogenase family protein [Psychrosphaera sp. 1_MG-2023]MDO6718184.1 aldehyde dehydrogenase family protein [Psychrosphaera sp. 1_MG-2023]